MKIETLKIKNKKEISIKFDKKEISLKKYAGKWVAFLGKKIVGSNKSLKKLMEEMEKKGLKEKVSVMGVPKHFGRLVF